MSKPLTPELLHGMRLWNMSEAAREMTLDEWVGRLPVPHGARDELARLRAELADLPRLRELDDSIVGLEEALDELEAIAVEHNDPHGFTAEWKAQQVVCQEAKRRRAAAITVARDARAKAAPVCHDCGKKADDTCPLCGLSFCRMCAEAEGESCCDKAAPACPRCLGDGIFQPEGQEEIYRCPTCLGHGKAAPEGGGA